MTDATRPVSADQVGRTIVIRVLSQRLRVDEAFFNALLDRARANIPELQFETAYRAQDIFGWAFWKALKNNWLRRLAGQVLAYLVIEKKLPLRFVSCQYCTTKRYMRL